MNRKADFQKMLKNLLIFLLSGIAVLALISYSQFVILVACFYLTMFLYSFLYFRKNQDKSSHIYFFVGYMILIIITYSYIYIHHGIIDTGEVDSRISNWDHYYFSVVTWTTLGYGDFRPSPESRLYAASEAFLGYIYMALFVAKLFDWMNGRGDNGTGS